VTLRPDSPGASRSIAERRGEFSLILATLGVAAGLDPRLGPFVALYVLVLAVGGPLLAARSSRLSVVLPARLFPVTGPGPGSA